MPTYPPNRLLPAGEGIAPRSGPGKPEPVVETSRSFSLSTPFFSLGFSWHQAEQKAQGPERLEAEAPRRQRHRAQGPMEAQTRREAIRRQQLAALLAPEPVKAK